MRARQQGMATLLWVLLMGLVSVLALFRVLSAVWANAHTGLEQDGARAVLSASERALAEGFVHLGPHGAGRTEGAAVYAALPLQEADGLFRRTWFCDYPDEEASGTARFSTSVCPLSPDEAPERCTPPARHAHTLEVLGCAWFPDGSGRLSRAQPLSRTPGLAQSPQAPLISAGQVVFEAGAWVANPVARFSVWSAQAAPPNAPRPVSWVPRQARVGGMPSLPATCENHADFVCTMHWPVRPDFVEADPLLASLTFETLAEHYLGLPPDTYRDSVAGFVLSPAQMAAMDGALGLSIWVKDDWLVRESAQMGQAQQPVLIIVEGDFTLPAHHSLAIHGFLLVKGAVRVLGRFTVHGAVVSGGDMSLSASTRIEYDDALVDGLARSGAFAPMAYPANPS